MRRRGGQAGGGARGPRDGDAGAGVAVGTGRDAAAARDEGPGDGGAGGEGTPVPPEQAAVAGRRWRPGEVLTWQTGSLVVGALVLVVLATFPGGPLSFAPPAVAGPLALAAAWGWGRRADGLWQRPPVAWPPWLAVALEAAAVAWVVAAFLLFKVAGLHPSGTDDNIYFYLAKRLSEGALPYRDHFFSHPPVHLLVPAAVFGVAGWSVGVAKAIPVLAQAVAAACLYLAARRSGRGFAALAVVLHLFAYQILMGSTDMNGENLMTAFLAGALLALSRGRPGLAGGLAGLALGCGLYALAGVLALGLAALVTGRGPAGRYLAGLGVAAGAWAGVFWALGGAAFWDGVVAYHLGKAVRDPGKVPLFQSANPFAWLGALLGNLGSFLADRDTWKSAYYHLFTLLAAGVAAAILAARAGRRAWTWATAAREAARPKRAREARREARAATARPPWVRGLASRNPAAFATLGLGAAALFVVQWSALAETYDFYLVPMWFFLALPASFAVHGAWQALGAAAGWRTVVVPGAVLAGLALHPLAGDELSDRLWPEERAALGERVDYPWREPWALKPLAGLSRSLYFKDHRARGIDEPPWRHALWNKQLTFGTVDEIAAVIVAEGGPDDTLTGASTLAPLVALQAGRRVAADEADTNAKRFSTGQWTEEGLARAACADGVRWLVGAQRSRFEPRRLESDPLWSRLFQRHREFTDRQLLHRREFPIVLYRLRDGASLPDGTPCRRGAGSP